MEIELTRFSGVLRFNLPNEPNAKPFQEDDGYDFIIKEGCYLQILQSGEIGSTISSTRNHRLHLQVVEGTRSVVDRLFDTVASIKDLPIGLSLNFHQMQEEFHVIGHLSWQPVYGQDRQQYGNKLREDTNLALIASIVNHNSTRPFRSHRHEISSANSLIEIMKKGALSYFILKYHENPESRLSCVKNPRIQHITSRMPIEGYFRTADEFVEQFPAFLTFQLELPTERPLPCPVKLKLELSKEKVDTPGPVPAELGMEVEDQPPPDNTRQLNFTMFCPSEAGSSDGEAGSPRSVNNYSVERQHCLKWVVETAMIELLSQMINHESKEIVSDILVQNGVVSAETVKLNNSNSKDLNLGLTVEETGLRDGDNILIHLRKDSNFYLGSKLLDILTEIDQRTALLKAYKGALVLRTQAWEVGTSIQCDSEEGYEPLRRLFLHVLLKVEAAIAEQGNMDTEVPALSHLNALTKPSLLSFFGNQLAKDDRTKNVVDLGAMAAANVSILQENTVAAKGESQKETQNDYSSSAMGEEEYLPSATMDTLDTDGDRSTFDSIIGGWSTVDSRYLCTRVSL